ncbi:MAG TPA: trypsin-like peptidase domain-containing protein [Longimicrobiales bacterium]|nr:trypsin-like peptidase domain-containing protein [Longimicrobiales bacterium]
MNSRRDHTGGKLLTLAAVAFLCVGSGGRSLPATGDAVSAYRLAATGLAGPAIPQAPDTGTPDRATPASLPQSAVSTPQVTVGQARDLSDAFARVAAAVTPAVVRIQTERPLPQSHRDLPDRFRDMFNFPDAPPGTPDLAGGSGVLVAPDGLILTNNHVVAGATRIVVTLWDKRTYEATVVGTDPTTDIALINVDATGLPAASLGDSDAIRVGEWVLAIGNPGFHDANTLDFTVTGGILSAKGRPLDVIRQELASHNDPAAAYAIEDFLQTDAAINPGNSGGPLIDLRGQVVGINTAIASGTGFNQGYGFAIPVNVARRVMRDLLEHGRVRRPLLGIGIQNVGPEDAEVYDLPRIAGVLVEDFQANSPAERAGLRRHDVIVAVNDQAVERLGQFQRLVALHEPGERINVEVIRYGQRHRFTVTLKEADLGGARVVRTPERERDSSLGIAVVDLTPTLARERRFREPGGALIAAVEPSSPARRRGVTRDLLIRSINRTPVSSAADAERMLRAATRGSIVSLVLEDAGGATVIRNVRVP